MHLDIMTCRCPACRVSSSQVPRSSEVGPGGSACSLQIPAEPRSEHWYVRMPAGILGWGAPLERKQHHGAQHPDWHVGVWTHGGQVLCLFKANQKQQLFSELYNIGQTRQWGSRNTGVEKLGSTGRASASGEEGPVHRGHLCQVAGAQCEEHCSCTPLGYW